MIQPYYARGETASRGIQAFFAIFLCFFGVLDPLFVCFARLLAKVLVGS